MHTYMLAVKQAKSLIPEAYVSKILEAYPTCVGWGYVKDGELQPIIVNDSIPLKEFLEAQEELKEQAVVFAFGKSDQKFMDDDIQPFISIEDEKKVAKLLSFIDGDFSGFEKPQSSHSSAFFAANEYLTPKLIKLAEGTDYKKALEALKDMMTRKEILTMCVGGKGTIIFLSEDGDLVEFTDKHTTRGKYPWGWTTNTLGYDVGLVKMAPEPAAEAAPVKRSFGTKKTAVASTIEVKPDNVEPAQPVTPAPAELKEEPEEIYELTKPPLGLSHGAKKKWYYRHNADKVGGEGVLPDRWKDGVAVYVKKGSRSGGTVVTGASIKSFAEMGDAIKSKNITPQHIPSPQPNVVSSERKLPVLSPGETNGIKDTFLKRIKVLEEKKPDVTFFKSFREKHPSFFQRAYGDKETNADGVVGLDIQTNWEYETRVDQCTNWPAAGALLQMDLNIEREMLKARVAELEEQNKLLNDLMDDEQDEDKKTEEAPPTVEPAPVKRSFGTRKAS